MKFLINNWAKAGGVIALCIIIFVMIYKNPVSSVHSIALLNLAFLMLHEFEEFVYPGGFKEFFNTRAYNPNGFMKHKVSDNAILIVNIVIGWGSSLAAIALAHKAPWLVLIVIFVIMLNGFLHLTVSFNIRGYNPGVITGVFLSIPLGVYAANQFSKQGLVNGGSWLFVIGTAIVVSFVIPVVIYLSRDKN